MMRFTAWNIQPISVGRISGVDAIHFSDHSVSGSLRDIRKTAIHPDYWYPVARSKHWRKGQAIGVSFAGEPIVLVRPQEGDAYSLEDRCAHRQVPLHQGV